MSVANAILRHRRLVVLCAVLAAALLSTVTLLAARNWTSRSSFMPQARRGSSGAAGLAAQLGISVPTLDGGPSPAFYADLLESDAILDSLAVGRYTFQRDGRTQSGTLAEAYDLRASTPGLLRDRVLAKLRGAITPVVVRQTGVVNVSVTANSPELARELATRLLAQVNRFNLESRKSQAASERQFTERRAAEARAELFAAESRLESFLERNRDFRNSASLTFQYDRLQREVTLRQQLFASLIQSFEQAKIEEVRDTPVITLVDAPSLPARPDPRGLVVRGLVALVAGTLLGSIVAIVRDRFLRMPADDDEYREFLELRRVTMQDVARPWRLVVPGRNANGSN